MNTKAILKRYKDEAEKRIEHEFPFKLGFKDKILCVLIYQAMRYAECLALFSVSDNLYRAYAELYKELTQIRKNYEQTKLSGEG
jgi:hypothetical protein